jgi:orotate phosphoribosyltransferase
MLLADRLNLPFIYIRSAAKAHGRRNTIEGILHSDAAVLVVEDLISTGGSSLNAVESVREAGANVVGVLAIFQYGFGKAAHAFEEARVPFRTLTSYTELLEQAVAGGYVSDGDLSTLHQWRENPEGWGALFV